MSEKRIEIVFAGVRTDESGTPKYQYYKVETGESLRFSKEIGTGNLVTSIIEVTETENGVQSPYVAKSFLTNDERISEWRTSDRAAKLFINAKKAAAKAKTGLEIEIDAIRFKYKRLPASQRALFISSLVYEITK